MIIEFVQFVMLWFIGYFFGFLFVRVASVASAVWACTAKVTPTTTDEELTDLLKRFGPTEHQQAVLEILLLVNLWIYWLS